MEPANPNSSSDGGNGRRQRRPAVYRAKQPAPKPRWDNLSSNSSNQTRAALPQGRAAHSTNSMSSYYCIRLWIRDERLILLQTLPPNFGEGVPSINSVTAPFKLIRKVDWNSHHITQFLGNSLGSGRFRSCCPLIFSIGCVRS